MTKQEHIDQVYELLGEVFRDKIEPQVVEGALNAAYNQLCFDLSNSGVKNFDLCRKRFTGIAVTWDSAADVYYSTYPAAIVPKLNVDMIVELVRGSGLYFYPSSEKTRRLVSGSQSDELNTGIPTILKRERIEYRNMESLSDDEIEGGSTPTPKVSTVRMDLAIEFRDFATTDEVYMPDGRDYQVYQLALDMIRNEPIIDVKND